MRDLETTSALLWQLRSIAWVDRKSLHLSHKVKWWLIFIYISSPPSPGRNPKTLHGFDTSAASKAEVWTELQLILLMLYEVLSSMMLVFKMMLEVQALFRPNSNAEFDSANG